MHKLNELVQRSPSSVIRVPYIILCLVVVGIIMEKITDKSYLLLMSAIQTRDLSTIVHALLGVEQIVFYMKNILESSYQSPASNHQLQVSELLDMDGQIPDRLKNLGAIDLSLKSASKQRSYDCYLSSTGWNNRDLDIKPMMVSKEHINEHIILTERSQSPVNLSPSAGFDDRTPSDGRLTDCTAQQSSDLRYPQSYFYGDAFKSPFDSFSSNKLVEHKKDDQETIKRSKDTHPSDYRFPSKRPMTCKLCSKIVRADNFQVHMRSHTGEKPYKCPICPFRSANPSSMPKHLRLHDRGREILKCTKCSYSTIYKSNLSAHHRRSHLHHEVKFSDSSPRSTSSSSSLTFSSNSPSINAQLTNVTYSPQDSEQLYGDTLLFNNINKTIQVVNEDITNKIGVDLTICTSRRNFQVEDS